MSIVLIGWGRFPDENGNKLTVPEPRLWNFLRANAAAIGRSFDQLMLPPASLTQSGNRPTGDGYGVVQRRMLDGTYYGDTEDFLAMNAAVRAHGATVIGDLPLHQFATMTKRYPHDARGAQTEGWFRGETSPKLGANGDQIGWNDPVPPYCKRDDVPSPADDFPFGKEIVMQNSNPPGVTEADAIDFLRWFSDLSNITEFRWDDAKGTHSQSVRRIMDSLPHAKFIAEYFDGNALNLNTYATTAPMNGRTGVEDFTMHWRIQAACNGFDATQLDQGGAGYWNLRPDLASGFVENPDTDLSRAANGGISQQVVFNKAQAYAYLLCLPIDKKMVYGKDYFPTSVWAGAYGLKPHIDKWCWISRMFAVGNFVRRWVDRDIYAYTRDGDGGKYGWSGGLLVVLNFNAATARTNTYQTTFPPHQHLHDYTGTIDDVWTDERSRVTFTMPPNASVGLAPAGVNRPYPVKTLATTQVIEGAQDLPPTLALRAGTNIVPYRLYCAKDTKLRLDLFLDPPIEAGTGIVVVVSGPDGHWYASNDMTGASGHLSATIGVTGWHMISMIAGPLLPPTKYKLSCSYTGAS